MCVTKIVGDKVGFVYCVHFLNNALNTKFKKRASFLCFYVVIVDS